MSIRNKVIFPYLILTLLLAVVGVYVVTQLVAGTLTERLTNQLLEAGRVVSDEMAKLEQKQLEAARLLAFTQDVSQHVHDRDSAELAELIKPAFGGLPVENLIVLDASGREMLHLLKQPNGSIKEAGLGSSASELKIVQVLLSSKNPQSFPGRQFGLDASDGRQYYFSAIPIPLNNEMVGVVVVGTSLQTLMPSLKNTSLADVTFYQDNGVAIASTFAIDADLSFLLNHSIDPNLYNKILAADNTVYGEVKQEDVEGRTYTIARGPIVIASNRVGVFAVALPTNFVTQSGTTSRDTYIVIFSIAAVGVILLGYFIARLITNPLGKLVETSQAITKGDLSQRTGIVGGDEIGILATTFDAMTENLQERTNELKRANRVLETMDRTKGNFIQVSAHELRTPLTLIQGYAQMLEMKSTKEADLGTLAKGILEGSDRMQDVVNSMLDISKIDSNALKLSLTDQQIHLVIAKVQKQFKTALTERNIKIKTENLDTLPLVPVDGELIYKAFYNIIINAIKYTPDGGHITVRGRVVSVDDKPKQMEIAVQDTGIGIDPKNQELVFEKFSQTGEVMLHSSGKTKFKGGGPGLGLAIARGIIEAHHGHIWVESPGYNDATFPGSTFYVRLPLNRPGK